jgi:hypothetical protein
MRSQQPNSPLTPLPSPLAPHPAPLHPTPPPPPQVKVETYDDIDELVDERFEAEAVRDGGAQTVLNEEGKSMPLPDKAH